MNEPVWAGKCRRCAHLRLAYKGRHWRCLRLGNDPKRYCAEMQIRGMCIFKAKPATQEAP